MLWLPFEDQIHVPQACIREALSLLGVALSTGPRGRRVSPLCAPRLWRTHPGGRWAEWLEQDYDDWDPLLQQLAPEEIPGLDELLFGQEADEEEPEVDVRLRRALATAIEQEVPADLWASLAERGVVDDIRQRVMAGDLTPLGLVTTWGTKLGGIALPRRASSECTAQQLGRGVAILGAEKPETPQQRLEFEDDGEEQHERKSEQRSRGVHAAFQAALRQIDSITARLREGDEATARQWAEAFVANQRATGTPDDMIGKSFSNLATQARDLGRLDAAYEWAREGVRPRPG